MLSCPVCGESVTGDDNDPVDPLTRSDMAKYIEIKENLNRITELNEHLEIKRIAKEQSLSQVNNLKLQSEELVQEKNLIIEKIGELRRPTWHNRVLGILGKTKNEINGLEKKLEQINSLISVYNQRRKDNQYQFFQLLREIDEAESRILEKSVYEMKLQNFVSRFADKLTVSNESEIRTELKVSNRKVEACDMLINSFKRAQSSINKNIESLSEIQANITEDVADPLDPLVSEANIITTRNRSRREVKKISDQLSKIEDDLIQISRNEVISDISEVEALSKYIVIFLKESQTRFNSNGHLVTDLKLFLSHLHRIDMWISRELSSITSYKERLQVHVDALNDSLMEERIGQIEQLLQREKSQT